MLLRQILGSLQDRVVHLIWAESVEGIKVSPSLLLAHLLLMVRREAAMFLRMSTGFGYAQVGDYTASLFYLFRWTYLPHVHPLLPFWKGW